MKDVNTFLSEMRSSSSEEVEISMEISMKISITLSLNVNPLYQVAAMWARCEELYNKKLWHQVLISFEATTRHSLE